jgi:hypothetical protein
MEVRGTKEGWIKRRSGYNVTEANVMSFLKKTMLLAGGICWLLFGIGFGFFVLQFLTQGAGLQFLGMDLPIFNPAVSSGSVLTGLVWMAGLSVAACLCLVMSLGMFVRGLGPAEEHKKGTIAGDHRGNKAG